jgi:cell division protein FtsZ
MIALHRSIIPSAPVIKILGLGGAGGNALDRLVLDGLEGAAVIALNTDVQSLNGCVAPQKIHLGKSVTRGLGAGGDPEIGYEAAEEAAVEIKAAIDGADMVFLCVGLGGGTGSGAAPLIAHMARETRAMVVAFATMPFSFEGKRRLKQAAESLAQLEEQADLLICFENDRLGEISSPTAGVQQAFVAADQLLSHAISAIAGIVRRGGIIPTGLDELAGALRRQHPRCLFGHGESEGANRAHEALARALKSPLMDKGKMLAGCESVVIHIAGGPDLTVQEITTLMDEFNRHIGDETRIDFGIGSDPKLGRRVCVTIISSTAAPLATVAAVPTPPSVSADGFLGVRQSSGALGPGSEAKSGRGLPHSKAAPAAPAIPEEDFDDDIHSEETDEPEPVKAAPVKAAPAKAAPAPVAQTYRKAPAEKAAAPAKKEEKAEQMTLEPANRGRFEKSEPTIVDGQDLDVPTFLRKNLKVK